jgi:hypothetical protein
MQTAAKRYTKSTHSAPPYQTYTQLSARTQLLPLHPDRTTPKRTVVDRQGARAPHQDNQLLVAACRSFLTSPASLRYAGGWVVLAADQVVLDAASDPGHFVNRQYPEPYAILSIGDPRVCYA